MRGTALRRCVSGAATLRVRYGRVQALTHDTRDSACTVALAATLPSGSASRGRLAGTRVTHRHIVFRSSARTIGRPIGTGVARRCSPESTECALRRRRRRRPRGRRAPAGRRQATAGVKFLPGAIDSELDRRAVTSVSVPSSSSVCVQRCTASALVRLFRVVGS